MTTPAGLMLAPPAPPEDSDGRRRRSQDSRARIVGAMLDLVATGEVSPGAEQVAERAGVGLRTVFRHFKDMDSLYGEMSQVIESEVRKVVEQPLTGVTWRERLLEIVQRRATVFERIAPYKRASDAHRTRSKFLAREHSRMVTTSREVLRRELPENLAKDGVLFETLDLLLSFEAWSRLRREQGLSVEATRATLEAAVRRLAG